VSGPGHLLAMLAVGLWTALADPRLAWVAPAGFLSGKAVDAVAGFAGFAPPGVEVMIVGSVMVFGALALVCARAIPLEGAVGGAGGDLLPGRLDQIPPDQEAAIIPPRKNAKPWKPDTAGAPRHCPRTNGGQCLDPERHPAHIEACRPDHLATMERLSPPKPCRDVRRIRKQPGGLFSRRSDALRHALGAAPVRPGLRPSGRGVPGPCRGREPHHRTRHVFPMGRRISLSAGREIPYINRSVQHV
jgi:hypothetical protein